MTKQQNQWEAMVSGQWFMPGTPETAEEHARGFETAQQLNDLGNTDPGKAREIIAQLIHPESGSTMIHAPINIEFGTNLRCGNRVFINFNATILAQAPITLGDDVMIGPNCSLITVGHPVADHQMRRGGWEQAKPISIGENTWLGANVTVLPGVSIGKQCVVGAGTLVTRDIPDNSLVLGSPGTVVRTLDDSQPLERTQLNGPVDGIHSTL
ncbi:sugar O-acetyltransferase [Corynebacterium sp.]|uniref:sugar O-acetyltransferase n=1 Tax=Corynebacterium sp. TaxID=1720 RepID=UPI0026481676|nr:sugar O-acetyltransferase [Corynebacterium sp.]MDN6137732.1 sugar O-acetyltransferase [Corynebacterium sp.]MDN6738196.1 sugar O-acetyltransferase [Corynebacterium sp.]